MLLRIAITALAAAGAVIAFAYAAMVFSDLIERAAMGAYPN